ncbi:hypothetical protein [Streptomyces sp. GS7]|uniref:hypothetical protein n=1 Tax=Streptomyces sp. GS7 TaxID=2692234 RepID=UPI0013178234|nr:hypothetical protein [Streptomyces sp. GS7]QHC23523.1 hypothetical protein GR130_21265 [Streptomyces sp. GS7]
MTASAPFRPAWAPRLTVAIAALASIAAAVQPAIGTPATRHPQQSDESTLLTCAVSTVPDQPLSFTPPLGQVPRTTTVHGTLYLTNCASPDGTSADLRSGTLTFDGNSEASCTSAEAIHGEGTITWHDANGRPVGSSTLRPNLHQLDTYNPGDALLAGTVTRGFLYGARVSGSATPTSDVSGCVLGGLSTISGRGKVAFLR